MKESESSDSPETTGSLLVPDPDSEYGYTVEEMPESYATTLTEEEFAEKFGSYQAINNVALSNYLPFTASICLVYLLNRFLQPRLKRFRWVNHLLSAALFFTLFMWRWPPFYASCTPMGFIKNLSVMWRKSSGQMFQLTVMLQKNLTS